MRIVTLLVAFTCLLLAFAPRALAEPWYVPMGVQADEGFNHIQTLILLPRSFSDPAFDPFFWAYEAPEDIDDLADDWAQTYRNPIWAAADGPSLGDYALIFDLWLPAQPPVGTIIHLQAYDGSTRVANNDLRYDGPTHNTWTVLDGTWNVQINLDEPQWIPGDTDLDDDVDWADYQHLEVGYGSGSTWFEGNFDGDNDVDWGDYQHLEVNYGQSWYTDPFNPQSLGLDRSVLTLENQEPATLSLMALGALALVSRKRKRS